MSSSKDPSIFNKFFQRFSAGPKKTTSINEKDSKIGKDDSDSVIPDNNLDTIVINSYNQSESLYRNPILDNPSSFIEPIQSTNSFPLRSNQNLSIKNFIFLKFLW